jgi:hypothetical protein
VEKVIAETPMSYDLTSVMAALEEADFAAENHPDPEKRAEAAEDAKNLAKLADSIQRSMVTAAEQNDDSYSEWTSGAMGLVQGGSFNLADEIGAGVRTLGGFAGDYTAVRDSLRAEFDQAQSDNPKSYLAGELSSAFIPGTGTAGLVKNIARAPSIAKAMTSGNAATSAAKVGIVEGGVSGFGASESDDAMGMLKDTAGGAAGGLATSLGLRGGIGAAKMVGGKVADGIGSFRSMESRGQTDVARALADDGIETGQDLVNRAAELGPEGRAIDVGENTRALGVQHGRRRGPGQRQMMETLQQRNAGASGRVEEGVVDAVGSRSRRSTLDAAAQEAQEQAAPLYRAAYETPLEITPSLSRLMEAPAVSAAIKKARVNMQNSVDEIMGRDEPGAGNTVRLLHYAMQELAEKADRAYAAGGKAAGDRFVALKNALRDELNAISPEFKRAQSIWADKSAAERAAKGGRDALGLDQLADDTLQDYGRLAGGEQAAFKLGMGDRLKMRLEQIKDTVAGQAQGVANKVVSTDAERQLVREVFGNGGENIIDLVSREAEFKNTYNRMSNSSSTQRLQDAKETTGTFSFGDVLSRAANGLKQAFSTELDDVGRAAAIDKLMEKLSDMSEKEAEEFLRSGRAEQVFTRIAQMAKPYTSRISSSEVAGRAADTLAQPALNATPWFNYGGVQ